MYVILVIYRTRWHVPCDTYRVSTGEQSLESSHL
jgi:hypothetical protein